MLENLPNDILLKIFATMSPEEMVQLEGVSSTMQSLVRDNLTHIIFRPKVPDQLAAQYAWLSHLAESHPFVLHTLEIHHTLRQPPTVEPWTIPGEFCWEQTDRRKPSSPCNSTECSTCHTHA